MSRYKAADLERMGAAARRQIELARHAMQCQDKLKREKAEAAKSGPRGRNKYGAKSYTDEDGRFHASKAEGERWRDLKLLHRQGRISNLIHQPKFDLVVNGHLICRYIADAEYIDIDGRRIVEDVKSEATITRVYRIKRALMAALHGITISEVRCDLPRPRSK